MAASSIFEGIEEREDEELAPLPLPLPPAVPLAAPNEPILFKVDLAEPKSNSNPREVGGGEVMLCCGAVENKLTFFDFFPSSSPSPLPHLSISIATLIIVDILLT